MSAGQQRDPQLAAAFDLAEAVRILERVDWRHVDGMTCAEAAALTQRLDEAREATQP